MHISSIIHRFRKVKLKAFGKRNKKIDFVFNCVYVFFFYNLMLKCGNVYGPSLNKSTYMEIIHKIMKTVFVLLASE